MANYKILNVRLSPEMFEYVRVKAFHKKLPMTRIVTDLIENSSRRASNKIDTDNTVVE